MNDPNIREILNRTALASYIADSNSRVVEELKLPVATARIDIAVVNGHLHGYEIKSSQDTLQRLPNQLVAYTKVFDYLTVVTELKYHLKVIDILPSWVGVSICSNKPDTAEYEIIRTAKLNTNQEGFFIAKLLWYSELIEILVEQKIPFKKQTRCWLLCETLAANIDTKTLSDLVRDKLKKRKDWKLKKAIN